MVQFMNIVIGSLLVLLCGLVFISYVHDRFWWNDGHSPSGRRWINAGKTNTGGRRYRDFRGYSVVIHWPIDHPRRY